MGLGLETADGEINVFSESPSILGPRRLSRSIPKPRCTLLVGPVADDDDDENFQRKFRLPPEE